MSWKMVDKRTNVLTLGFFLGILHQQYKMYPIRNLNIYGIICICICCFPLICKYGLFCKVDMREAMGTILSTHNKFHSCARASGWTDDR